MLPGGGVWKERQAAQNGWREVVWPNARLAGSVAGSPTLHMSVGMGRPVGAQENGWVDPVVRLERHPAASFWQRDVEGQESNKCSRKFGIAAKRQQRSPDRSLGIVG